MPLHLPQSLPLRRADRMQLGKLRKDSGEISEHVLGASVALWLLLPAAPSSAPPPRPLPQTPPLWAPRPLPLPLT